MGLPDMLASIVGMFKRSKTQYDGRNGAGYQPPRNPSPIPPPPAPRATTPAAFTLTSELLADGVDVTQARALPWVQPLNDVMVHYSINTPARAAAFVAQLAHESVKFAFTKEIWGPTPVQLAYEPPSEKAEELGNTVPGDGLRFCGRGLIQVTGRANYVACGAGLGLDLISNPALLEQPEYAALSAGWFWDAHGLNVYADTNDFVTLTKRINGGTNGLADRQALWASCKSTFGA
jgi:putative chitinase